MLIEKKCLIDQLNEDLTPLSGELYEAYVVRVRCATMNLAMSYLEQDDLIERYALLIEGSIKRSKDIFEKHKKMKEDRK